MCEDSPCGLCLLGLRILERCKGIPCEIPYVGYVSPGKLHEDSDFGTNGLWEWVNMYCTIFCWLMIHLRLISVWKQKNMIPCLKLGPWNLHLQVKPRFFRPTQIVLYIFIVYTHNIYIYTYSCIWWHPFSLSHFPVLLTNMVTALIRGRAVV